MKFQYLYLKFYQFVISMRQATIPDTVHLRKFVPAFFLLEMVDRDPRHKSRLKCTFLSIVNKVDI